MSIHMTIGQVLATDDLSEYEKELIERYFEIVFNGEEPDKQLAKEMFQTFNFLLSIRFGSVVLTRERV